MKPRPPLDSKQASETGTNAYRAFVLGLRELIINNKLAKPGFFSSMYKDFFTILNKHFTPQEKQTFFKTKGNGDISWDDFKNYITSKDEESIQKDLVPVFKKLAVEKLKKLYTEESKQKEKSNQYFYYSQLRMEFNRYITQRKSDDEKPTGIFSYFASEFQRWAKIAKEQNLEAALHEIHTDWFTTDENEKIPVLYDKFLHFMEKENNFPGTSNELFLFEKEFGIKIRIGEEAIPAQSTSPPVLYLSEKTWSVLKQTSVLDKEEQDSERDNNCTFNSFILGIRTMLIRRELTDEMLRIRYPEPNDFLSEFATKSKIKVTTWKEFSNYFINAKDLVKLQKDLAPAFRHWSNKLLRDKKGYQGAHHQALVLNLLQADFDDFLNGNRRSDVFDSKSMDFVTTKFSELSTKYKEGLSNAATRKDTIDKIKKEDLKTWWEEPTKKGGYNQFLSVMNTDKEWAGDLELAPLAEYFGISLDLYRANAPNMSMHSEHGLFDSSKIPEQSREQVIRDLRSRDLIEPNPVEPNKYKWLKPKSIEPSRTAFLGLIKNIPHAQEILEQWHRTYDEPPVMTLKNDRGQHWSLVVYPYVKPFKLFRRDQAPLTIEAGKPAAPAVREVKRQTTAVTPEPPKTPSEPLSPPGAPPVAATPTKEVKPSSVDPQSVPSVQTESKRSTGPVVDSPSSPAAPIAQPPKAAPIAPPPKIEHSPAVESSPPKVQEPVPTRTQTAPLKPLHPKKPPAQRDAAPQQETKSPTAMEMQPIQATVEFSREQKAEIAQTQTLKKLDQCEKKLQDLEIKITEASRLGFKDQEDLKDYVNLVQCKKLLDETDAQLNAWAKNTQPNTELQKAQNDLDKFKQAFAAATKKLETLSLERSLLALAEEKATDLKIAQELFDRIKPELEAAVKNTRNEEQNHFAGRLLAAHAAIFKIQENKESIEPREKLKQLSMIQTLLGETSRETTKKIAEVLIPLLLQDCEDLITKINNYKNRVESSYPQNPLPQEPIVEAKKNFTTNLKQTKYLTPYLDEKESTRSKAEQLDQAFRNVNTELKKFEQVDRAFKDLESEMKKLADFFSPLSDQKALGINTLKQKLSTLEHQLSVSVSNIKLANSQLSETIQNKVQTKLKGLKEEILKLSRTTHAGIEAIDRCQQPIKDLLSCKADYEIYLTEIKSDVPATVKEIDEVAIPLSQKFVALKKAAELALQDKDLPQRHKEVATKVIKEANETFQIIQPQVLQIRANVQKQHTESKDFEIFLDSIEKDYKLTHHFISTPQVKDVLLKAWTNQHCVLPKTDQIKELEQILKDRREARETSLLNLFKDKTINFHETFIRIFFNNPNANDSAKKMELFLRSLEAYTIAKFEDTLSKDASKNPDIDSMNGIHHSLKELDKITENLEKLKQESEQNIPAQQRLKLDERLKTLIHDKSTPVTNIESTLQRLHNKDLRTYLTKQSDEKIKAFEKNFELNRDFILANLAKYKNPEDILKLAALEKNKAIEISNQINNTLKSIYESCANNDFVTALSGLAKAQKDAVSISTLPIEHLKTQLSPADSKVVSPDLDKMVSDIKKIQTDLANSYSTLSTLMGSPDQKEMIGNFNKTIQDYHSTKIRFEAAILDFKNHPEKSFQNEVAPIMQELNKNHEQVTKLNIETITPPGLRDEFSKKMDQIKSLHEQAKKSYEAAQFEVALSKAKEIRQLKLDEEVSIKLKFKNIAQRIFTNKSGAEKILKAIKIHIYPKQIDALSVPPRKDLNDIKDQVAKIHTTLSKEIEALGDAINDQKLMNFIQAFNRAIAEVDEYVTYINETMLEHHVKDIVAFSDSKENQEPSYRKKCQDELKSALEALAQLPQDFPTEILEEARNRGNILTAKQNELDAASKRYQEAYDNAKNKTKNFYLQNFADYPLAEAFPALRSMLKNSEVENAIIKAWGKESPELKEPIFENLLLKLRQTEGWNDPKNINNALLAGLGIKAPGPDLFEISKISNLQEDLFKEIQFHRIRHYISDQINLGQTNYSFLKTLLEKSEDKMKEYIGTKKYDLKELANLQKILTTETSTKEMYNKLKEVFSNEPQDEVALISDTLCRMNLAEKVRQEKIHTFVENPGLQNALIRHGVDFGDQKPEQLAKSFNMGLNVLMRRDMAPTADIIANNLHIQPNPGLKFDPEEIEEIKNHQANIKLLYKHFSDNPGNIEEKNPEPDKKDLDQWRIKHAGYNTRYHNQVLRNLLIKKGCLLDEKNPNLESLRNFVYMDENGSTDRKKFHEVLKSKITPPSPHLTLELHKLARIGIGNLERNVIQFECYNDALVLKLIGLDGQVKTLKINWDQLPNFPKDPDKILSDEKTILPKILDITSKVRPELFTQKDFDLVAFCSAIEYEPEHLQNLAVTDLSESNKRLKSLEDALSRLPTADGLAGTVKQLNEKKEYSESQRKALENFTKACVAYGIPCDSKGNFSSNGEIDRAATASALIDKFDDASLLETVVLYNSLKEKQRVLEEQRIQIDRCLNSIKKIDHRAREGLIETTADRYKISERRNYETLCNQLQENKAGPRVTSENKGEHTALDEHHVDVLRKKVAGQDLIITTRKEKGRIIADVIKSPWNTQYVATILAEQLKHYSQSFNKDINLISYMMGCIQFLKTTFLGRFDADSFKKYLKLDQKLKHNMSDLEITELSKALARIYPWISRQKVEIPSVTVRGKTILTEEATLPRDTIIEIAVLVLHELLSKRSGNGINRTEPIYVPNDPEPEMTRAQILYLHYINTQLPSDKQFKIDYDRRFHYELGEDTIKAFKVQLEKLTAPGSALAGLNNPKGFAYAKDAQDRREARGDIIKLEKEENADNYSPAHRRNTKYF